MASRKGRSALAVWRPQGGLLTIKSAAPRSTGSEPSVAETISTDSASPIDSAFASAASQAPGSASTRIARPAPIASAPSPSTPLPAPRSATVQPSVRSSNAEMSASQRAARSPSVVYCSSSMESHGCGSRPDSSIPSLRTLMGSLGPLVPKNQFSDFPERQPPSMRAEAQNRMGCSPGA